MKKKNLKILVGNLDLCFLTKDTQKSVMKVMWKIKSLKNKQKRSGD